MKTYLLKHWTRLSWVFVIDTPSIYYSDNLNEVTY